MAFTHIDCFSGPGGICTGMYSMSNIDSFDRIYKDEGLELLIEHASAASHKFISARQRFDRYWCAVQNH